jgi:hypothetical protein
MRCSVTLSAEDLEIAGERAGTLPQDIASTQSGTNALAILAQTPAESLEGIKPGAHALDAPIAGVFLVLEKAPPIQIPYKARHGAVRKFRGTTDLGNAAKFAVHRRARGHAKYRGLRKGLEAVRAQCNHDLGELFNSLLVHRSLDLLLFFET